MGQVRNILFIMADQLRWDALSCYGATAIDTPNIDRLCARGVRFDRAYAQGATCGSSRMSFYTGRYVYSHGARYNDVPLRVGEPTMGDHLRRAGVDTYLVGKTHSTADRAGMELLGIEPDSPMGRRHLDAGFDTVVRYEGLHPDGWSDTETAPYNTFLRERGYEGENPWHTAANGGRDPEGRFVSGWLLRSGGYPAIVADEHSETAWTTDLAIDFITRQADRPWALHLSYIKPHWPYIVSAPYHDQVDVDSLPTPNRSDSERGAHPATGAFHLARIGRTFSNDEVRQTVYRAYFGLIRQLDDHLGRLWAALDKMGRTDDTMIVLTSDHGDYLGDHWMGEKDYLHEEAVRLPFIVADPSPSADGLRGTSSDALVESIDLVPTFVDRLGGAADDRWLEGRSLAPVLDGSTAVVRDGSFAEADYGFREMRDHLSVDAPRWLRATMVRADRWKYLFHELYEPQLFDLENDPGELADLGTDPGYATIRSDLRSRLEEWFRRRDVDPLVPPRRLGRSPAEGGPLERGIAIGYWDEATIEEVQSRNAARP